jgi:hypothetical protein
MSLIVSEKADAYQLAPEGIHPARCAWIVDLGTQHDDYNGKSKRLRKVRISWELPNEKTVFDEEKGEEPFLVSKEYTKTLGTKSNLRHDIESWRGKGFTGSEAEAFDLAVLLGKPCMVNVIHEVSKLNRKYAKIIGVTPLPKGMQAPAQILPSLQYSIEDGLEGAFKELPEFVRQKILASDELGESPTVEGVAERNVRQATANALSADIQQKPKPHPPVGIHESSSGDDLDSQLEDEVNAQAQLATGANDEPEW